VEQGRVIGGVEGIGGIIAIGPFPLTVKDGVIELEPLPLIVIERPLEELHRVDDVDNQIANISQNSEKD
jgi:hypothetical protein